MTLFVRFCSTILQCLHVLQKSGSHIALLDIVNKVDYSLSVLYRVSSIVFLKKFLQLHVVIIKLCALKDWFDYNQCRRWGGGGGGGGGGEVTGAVCPRPLV